MSLEVGLHRVHPDLLVILLQVTLSFLASENYPSFIPSTAYQWTRASLAQESEMELLFETLTRLPLAITVGNW
jgi:hypothetical protein